ncbi:MAG: hypothetical protein HRT72_11515, partial [Flavobacteriales bacterium]|nr:hypothetical protein [Flavobacteriales bacterium]
MDKNSKYDKFDNFFQEGLNDYEAPYSDDVWNKLENSLDGLPEKSNNTVKYISGIAGVAILIGAAIFSTTSDNNTATTINNTENSIVTTSPFDAIEKETTDNTEPSNSESINTSTLQKSRTPIQS